MAAYDYETLKEHVGHQIEVVTYADEANVAFECTDCNMVLIDYNRPDGEEGEAEHHSYLVVVDSEASRDIQVSTDVEPDMMNENWIDLSSSVVLGTFIAENKQKAIEYAVDHHGVPAKSLSAHKLDLGEE